MTGIWRCLHPRLLFQNNLNLFAGVGFFLAGSAGVFALKSNHPHAVNVFFPLLGLAFFFMVSGFLFHYWRLISEDLLRLLPDFRRQSRSLFFVLLFAIMALFFVELLHIPIVVPEAYLFSTYIAFWAAIFALFLGLGGYRREDRKAWQIFPLLTIYPVLYFAPARKAFLAIPGFLDWTLGTVLLLLIALLMGKTPREWQEYGKALLHFPREFCLRGMAWDSFWHWMPGSWHSPILDTARRPLGIPAVLLIQPLIPLLIFGLEYLRLGAVHLPALLPFFPVLFLIPVMTWGAWPLRVFDWQYLMLTGRFGGNHGQVSTQILKNYAAHTSLLALALLFWPALILIYLGYPALQISMILWILYSGILVMAWAPMGVIGLGITGIWQQVTVILSYFLDALMVARTTHYWFYRHLIHVPFHLRGTGVLLILALLSAGLAAFLARRKLQNSDWNLTHYTGKNVPLLQGIPQSAPIAGNSPIPHKSLYLRWGPWSALLLFLAFFLGQAMIAIIIVMLRDFVLGIQLGIHYAALHEKIPHLVEQKAFHTISSPLRIWLDILGYSLSVLAVLFFLLRTFPKTAWRSAKNNGLAWCAPSRPSGYGLAILLALGLGLIAHLLFQFIPPPHHLNPRSLGLFEGLKGTGFTHYVVLLLLIVIAPFAEEIIFRGAIYTGLRRRFSVIWSAIFVSLLFILAHIPSKVEQFHYPPSLIIIALLAAALIFLRIRYRSLWPGILLHMLWNSSGFLLLLWH
ncbi:hypothetical protein B1757_12725 [Acidithiobacillus marinus]|uniref:CAAX prenyl protease 2/Lysostaphin resistance protein A-like domain-containing protein n=1 Tax=Acidithiobacillus marinus TaxID=187490 RepID=A0A2I1DJ05_9PROT|nr:CPBP family intramembrane glutamic endopeptidase [Acidithiobacillus marinus]PKY09856.1 hypothetical protein B1757_12725 [Acidithiobacillus marinus]